MNLNWRKIAIVAAEPMRWLIVIGMAYTLATTALFMLSSGESAPAASGPSPAADAEAAVGPNPDLNAILNANLFGKAGEKPAVEEVPEEPTVETRLPLVLHGVFVAKNPTNSTAIVAQKGRAGEIYGIGERMPGNATLEAVHRSHIVLKRAGTRETLRFPGDGKGMVVPSKRRGTDADRNGFDSPLPELAEREIAAIAPPPDASGAGQAARQVLRQFQERAQKDPQAVLDELGLEAVADGDAAGYRLSRMADSSYLRQTGLQSGDLILSVNGQPVGDIDPNRLNLDNLLAQGQARIEVQRGERRFFVTASLN